MRCSYWGPSDDNLAARRKIEKSTLTTAHLAASGIKYT
jgi:hypothetical protein